MKPGDLLLAPEGLHLELCLVLGVDERWVRVFNTRYGAEASYFAEWVIFPMAGSARIRA